MGRPRSELQVILREIMGQEGNVYFQPPSNVTMTYPAIVYQRDYAETAHADNVPYRTTKRYQVTVITDNPDSDIPDKVAKLPMSTYQRFFVADDLNHDVYQLFF